MTLGYKVALGWDIPMVDLDPIIPQPRSEGVKYARRIYAAGGSVFEENPYVELEWDVIGGIFAYDTLLTQLGLFSNRTSQVTITVPEFSFTFNRFCGVAIRPEHGREVRRNNYFIRNLVIAVQLKGYAGN